MWLAVGTSFVRAALLLSILTPLFLPSSSVSLSYFVLAVPMSECLWKHLCMSSPCPIAILNGTFLFSRSEIVCNLGRSFVYQNQIKLNSCSNTQYVVIVWLWPIPRLTLLDEEEYAQTLVREGFAGNEPNGVSYHCWVDPACAWKKHWRSNCRLSVDGGGGTPRPVLLTGAKKSPWCLISFELLYGLSEFRCPQ